MKEQRRSDRLAEVIATALGHLVDVDLGDDDRVALAREALEAVGIPPRREPGPGADLAERGPAFDAGFAELCKQNRMVAAYVVALEAAGGTRLVSGGVAGLAKVIDDALRKDLLEEQPAGGLWTPGAPT